MWDLVSKSSTATLKGHFSAVTSLSLASDGWTLLSGSRDGVAIVWDLRNFSKTSTIPVYEALEGIVALPPIPESALERCAPSTRGSTASKKSTTKSKPVLCFITGGDKGLLKMWRSDTGACIHDAVLPGMGTPTVAGSIVELMIVPGGDKVLAGTQDCRLLLASLGPLSSASQTKIGSRGSSNNYSSMLQLERQLIGNNDEVTDLRFLTASHTAPLTNNDPSTSEIKNKKELDDPTHLAVSTNSEHIRIFDARTLNCIAILSGHTDIVLCIDALRDHMSGNTLLASGSKDTTVRLWNAFSGRCLAVGDGHVGAVSAVAFSRKGEGFLVSGGADKLLKVWRYDAAWTTAAAAAVGDTDTDIEFTNGDTSDALQGQKRKKLEKTQEKRGALKVAAAVAAHDKDINAVAVAPNDSIVATASQDRTIKIWNLPNLVLSKTLKGHKRGVWSVAFSPVDQALASSSGDKTIRLWALRDGTCLRTFEGHLASVLRVDFISTGAQLLSAGGDGLMKLWSPKTSECINTFDAADDKIWSMHVNGRAGRIVATGSGDGTVAVWEDCTHEDARLEAAENEATLLAEQELSNALFDRNWLKASTLAFEMNRPGKLLSIVNQAQEHSVEMGQKILEKVAKSLNDEQLKLCLHYCREWNANAKTCYAAQSMLHAVLCVHPPETISKLPGCNSLLDGISAYSQRHFDRVHRLVRSTYIIDYILGGLNVLMPEGELDGTERVIDNRRNGNVGLFTETGGGGGGGDDDDGDLLLYMDDGGDEEEEEKGLEEEEEKEVEDLRNNGKKVHHKSGRNRDGALKAAVKRKRK